MQNGEISAAPLSDTFAYSMVKDGRLKCIRSQPDTDFADRVCCVMAMSGKFGLSDEFTGDTLKDFIEHYIRPGLITSMTDADEVLEPARNPVL